MSWRPYQACCQRHAPDTDVLCCPECGNILLRCLAFAECGTLVTPTQACPSCFAPTLMIDKGAVVQSRQGERLSIPLILFNASPAARPVWVKRIVRWSEGRSEPLALTWERLDARTERRLTIDTPPMEVGGTHTLQLVVVIASRHKTIEEEYAFSAGMSVTVASADAQNIYQNIVVSGTGGMVDANIKHGETRGPAGLDDRALLALDRAEKFELEEGIRGYRQQRLRVPRNVEFSFAGFAAREQPPAGTTASHPGRLAFGRNSRKGDPPNDVCIRAYDQRTGQIDEPATMAISRHHLDFVVVNDRLCVQARATTGVDVNGKIVTAGDLLPVVPGDRIAPIPGRPDKLTLQVAFLDAIDVVERITVSRSPIAPHDA